MALMALEAREVQVEVAAAGKIVQLVMQVRVMGAQVEVEEAEEVQVAVAVLEEGVLLDFIWSTMVAGAISFNVISLPVLREQEAWEGPEERVAQVVPVVQETQRVPVK